MAGSTTVLNEPKSSSGAFGFPNGNTIESKSCLQICHLGTWGQYNLSIIILYRLTLLTCTLKHAKQNSTSVLLKL